MKIIDCTTYFNEPLLFELRLNILEKYVDEFLVCEARFTHSGEKKNFFHCLGATLGLKLYMS